MHYVLNESVKRDQRGRLDVFPSLQMLLLHIHPHELRDHNYYAYDTDGYLLDIHVDHNSGRIAHRGRTKVQDQEALDRMLRELVESIRALHPDCILTRPDQVARMTGMELTGLILLVHDRVHRKWLRNRLSGQLRRRLVVAVRRRWSRSPVVVTIRKRIITIFRRKRNGD